MDPLYSAFLGSFVRWFVTTVMTVLVAHHIIAVDQTAYFTDGLSHKLLVALPLLTPLVWSLVQKYTGRVKFLTALQAAPGTTEHQVEQRIENGMGASVKTGAVLVACVLAVGSTVLPGCGPKQYHTAVVANTSIAQAIFALQDAEIAAHTAGLITADKHAAYKTEILHLLEAGDDLTLALKDWNPSQPVPANVGLAIGKVQLLLTDLQINSPQASALLYTVQTVLSVLRGSVVLPAAALEQSETEHVAPRWAGRGGASDDDSSNSETDDAAIDRGVALRLRRVHVLGLIQRGGSERFVGHDTGDPSHALILLPEVIRG